MLIRTLILLFFAFPAFAQDPTLRYAVAPDLATALTYSQAAWTALKCSPQPQCDARQVTTQWYPIIGLSDLTRYAIVIHDGDVYQGQTITLPSGKSFQLTAQQIAALQTRAQVGTLLPDILQLALVASRMTGPETSAITTYANAHASFKTNYQTLTSGPIDLQNPLTNTVFNELQSAGVLTAARIAVILAPQPAAQVTQSIIASPTKRAEIAP